jgi:hypothetical protein
VAVVMVNIDEEDFLVPLYLKKHPASAQVLLVGQDGKKTEDAYGINGIPTNFFLDQKGIVRSYMLGFDSEKKLRENLDSLLSGSTSPAP